MATLTYSFTVPPQSTNGTLSVPGFDPDLGTLEKINVVAVVDFQYRLMAENNAITAGAFVFGGGASDATIVVTTPMGIAILSQPDTPPTTHSQTLAARDTVIDFAGASGMMRTFGSQYVYGPSVTPVTGSTLNEFIGTPGVPGTIVLPIVRVGIWESTAATDLITAAAVRSGLSEFTLVYRYTPA